MLVSRFKSWADSFDADEDGDMIVQVAVVCVGLGILAFFVTVVFPRFKKYINDVIPTILNTSY